MRHPPAVNLQYFLCIITLFKDCYKLYRLALPLRVRCTPIGGIAQKYTGALASGALTCLYKY